MILVVVHLSNEVSSRLHKYVRLNKYRFVVNGVLCAALNEMLPASSPNTGYSSCDVTLVRKENIFRASYSQVSLVRRITVFASLPFLSKMIQVLLKHHRTLAEKMQTWVLSAVVQCECLRYKLLGGLQVAIRLACYGMLRFVMEIGAKGREVVVSVRAKSMKFIDEFIIHSGQSARGFIDYAVHHVLLHRGVPQNQSPACGRYTQPQRAWETVVIWAQVFLYRYLLMRFREHRH